MKRLATLTAILVLTGFAWFPRLALADDGLAGLDVTMEVLDEEAEFDELTSDLRGPNDEGLEKRDFEDGDPAEDTAGEAAAYDFEDAIDERDEFEDDEMSEADILKYEDDYEDMDGEDVDLEDEFDDADLG